MKRTKKTYLSIILALLLAVAPFLIASADSNPYSTDITSIKVSFSQALSIVSDAYPDLTLLALSLDDENGVSVYQAELLDTGNSSVVEIAIDSESGQISVQADDDNKQDGQDGENVQYEDKSDDNGKSEQNEQDDQSDQNESDGENVQYEDQFDDNGNAEQDEVLDISTVEVSFNQALSIVNTAYPDYTLFALELDSENGSLVYQAELLNTSDNSILEVKLDPVSGQVLSQAAGEDEHSGNAVETENESENETENGN